MSLFNLDGTSIFGVGSEWFWAMAQFLLVAASIVGIYLQLRAQRSSNLYGQSEAWSREWNEELFMVHRLAALYDLEGRPVEAGLPWSAAILGDFFERIGYLVDQRHLRAEDVWNALRPAIGAWWTWCEPYLERTRSQARNPAIYEGFEKLELDMRRLDARFHGPAYRYEAPLALREAAHDVARQLHLIADARNGIYPMPRAATENPGA